MELKGQPGASSVASPSYLRNLQIGIMYFMFLRHPVAKSLREGIYSRF
jgi:hypothetical protein